MHSTTTIVFGQVFTVVFGQVVTVVLGQVVTTVTTLGWPARVAQPASCVLTVTGRSKFIYPRRVNALFHK